MEKIDQQKADLRVMLDVFRGQIDEQLQGPNLAFKRKPTRPDAATPHRPSGIADSNALLKSVTRNHMVSGGKMHPFDNITLHDFDPIYRRRDHSFMKSPAVPGLSAEPGARRGPSDRLQFQLGGMTQGQIQRYKGMAAERLKQFELADDPDRDQFEREADLEAIRQK